jgi:hypothetical protein
VKDTQGTTDQFDFVLPGQSRTHYFTYAKLFTGGNYPGPVVVEVSSQTFARNAYALVEDARVCDSALA